MPVRTDSMRRFNRDDAQRIVEEVDPGSPDLRRCLNAYAEELAERFPEGYSASDLLDPGTLRKGGAALLARERGHAVGRRLLAALERSARECGMRAVRLDTHEVLTEAIQLYESAGYREIPPYGANPYARRWFEKPLGSGPS